MKDPAAKTFKFYDAIITLKPEDRGVSWSAELPPPVGFPDEENLFCDGVIYGTFLHAVMAARLHLKMFYATLELQRFIDNLYDRRDGTIQNYSQYSLLSESLDV